MSERKAINKYYPPDWDPSQVVKKKRKGGGIPDIKIRMMAPYSMRCLKCNEYIAERRSFNARKEVTSEKYLNTKIIRFHISCPRCNNKISFKTNPQVAGYTPEEGAVRNYEPKAKTSEPKQLKQQETEDELLARLEKEEQENQSFQTLKEQRKKNPFWQKSESLKDAGNGDVMQNLENKLIEQQRQQVINDQLEDLAFKSSQLQAKGGSDALINEAKEKLDIEIKKLEGMKSEIINQEDDAIAREAFKKRNGLSMDQKPKADQLLTNIKSEGVQVKRKSENTETESERKSVESKFVIKRKRTAEAQAITPTIVKPTLATSLGGYSSSDEE